MLATSAASAAAGGSLSLTWDDCGDSSTHAKCTTLGPDSVSLGSDTNIVGSGATDKTITGGTFDLHMTAGGGIVNKHFTGNNCEAKTFSLPLGLGKLAWGGLDCPVSGTANIKVTTSLSGSLPASLATSKVALTAVDQDSEAALCVNLNLKKQSFKDIADHVNSLGSSWTAEAPARFGEIDDVKSLLGTVMRGDETFVEMDSEMSEVANVDIPADFDVRTAFPDCAEVSGNIRDQSSCGSCWAFGSTEAFNDRHCIATGDKTKLSVEDTTANCGFFQCFSQGCNGGQPGQAWQWFKKKGVVTGGDFTDIGAGETCAPYSLKPCAHHVPTTEKYGECPSTEYSTPSLSECSENSYGKKYKDDKIHASDAYSLSGIQAIQADMVQYGSATAAFTVYADFPAYKSGVYKHVTGAQLGGHAIKMLGWGTLDGEDYWLIANSWNEMWGDGGTFKIARGSNECGIEGQVSAGRAGSSILA